MPRHLKQMNNSHASLLITNSVARAKCSGILSIDRTGSDHEDDRTRSWVKEQYKTKLEHPNFPPSPIENNCNGNDADVPSPSKSAATTLSNIASQHQETTDSDSAAVYHCSRRTTRNVRKCETVVNNFMNDR